MGFLVRLRAKLTILLGKIQGYLDVGNVLPAVHLEPWI